MAFCAVIAPIQPLARSYKDFLGLAPSGRRASLALATLPCVGLSGLPEIVKLVCSYLFRSSPSANRERRGEGLVAHDGVFPNQVEFL